MWQLIGSTARLETPKLNCQLDLKLPVSGLTGVTGALTPKHRFQAPDMSIMQLMLPVASAPVADTYVRGNDLVATFEESTVHRCRTQVYWRIEDESNFCGIQMIVSVQTSILDANPGLSVTSKLGRGVQVIDDGIALCSLPDSEVCYVEVADSSNVESMIVLNESQITSRLFPGSLEKGVIRRARLLGCFVSGEAADATARSIRDEFIRSAPPLTT